MLIFIPAKNMARPLRRAVRSVAAQTCDDWRLLILVDKSSDGATFDAARNAQRRLGWRKVTFKRSAKPALPAMYDEAIRAAKEDIIGVLDADDELTPSAVGDVLRAFGKHPTTDFLWTKHVISPGYRPGLSGPLPKGKTLLEAILDRWWKASHWKVLRREAYLRSPLPLSDMECATDLNLVCTLVAAEPKTLFLPKVCYIYHTEAKNRETLMRWRKQCRQARAIRKRLVGWWYGRDK